MKCVRCGKELPYKKDFWDVPYLVQKSEGKVCIKCWEDEGGEE